LCGHIRAEDDRECGEDPRSDRIARRRVGARDPEGHGRLPPRSESAAPGIDNLREDLEGLAQCATGNLSGRRIGDPDQRDSGEPQHDRERGNGGSRDHRAGARVRKQSIEASDSANQRAAGGVPGNRGVSGTLCGGESEFEIVGNLQLR